MISYILEVSICWLGFYLLYLLLLSKETFFQLNRWYLVSTLVLSLCLPFSANLSLFDTAQDNISTFLVPVTYTVEVLEASVVTSSEENTTFNLSSFLFGIYLLGIFVTSIRFLKGLFQIYSLYKNAIKAKLPQGYTLVRTKKIHLPFSFFNCLFWSESMSMDEEEHENILSHEETHVHQKHSIDVLLLEIMGILFWCSPMIYFYKKSLRVVHEYLADNAVLENVPVKDYGQLLLKQSHSPLHIALANHFIQSQLKKRIVMMTRPKSHKPALIKYFLVFPMLVFMMVMFSQKEGIAQVVPEEEVFIVVEDMPRFPGCESMAKNERKMCSQKKMLEYIYRNIKYPESARKKNIEGTVVIKFVVQKDGTIADATIVRNLGEGLGQEALRVVNSMPTWIAGKQRGRPVNVYYTLPVKYKLEGESKIVEVAPPPMVDMTIEEVAESPVVEKSHLPPPPPPPPPAPRQEGEVFRVVEQMPRFPGCEDVADKHERTKCSQKKMLEYIYKNITYPKNAKENGTQGTVIINFVVEENGSLSNFRILRDIGDGCGAEALRVLQSMNDRPEKWIPGQQRGKPVKVNFNLPIKFRLSDDTVVEDRSTKPQVEQPQVKHDKLYLKEFKVSPNPTNGVFTVDVKGNKGFTSLTMTNINGKELFKVQLTDFDGNYQKEFNMNKVPKGTYFINILQSGKIATQKVVIQ